MDDDAVWVGGAIAPPTLNGFLERIEPDGVILQRRRLGAAVQHVTRSGGDLYVAGVQAHVAGSRGWVARLDSAGWLQWYRHTRELNHPWESFYTSANNVTVDANGDVVVSASLGVEPAAALFTFSPGGAPLEQRLAWMPQSGRLYRQAGGALLTLPDGVAVAGTSASRREHYGRSAIVQMYSTTAADDWQTVWDSPPETDVEGTGDDRISDLVLGDGYVLVAGARWSPPHGSALWVARLELPTP
jgi:hypothetical protein